MWVHVTRYFHPCRTQDDVTEINKCIYFVIYRSFYQNVSTDHFKRIKISVFGHNTLMIQGKLQFIAIWVFMFVVLAIGCISNINTALSVLIPEIRKCGNIAKKMGQQVRLVRFFSLVHKHVNKLVYHGHFELLFYYLPSPPNTFLYFDLHYLL